MHAHHAPKDRAVDPEQVPIALCDVDRQVNAPTCPQSPRHRQPQLPSELHTHCVALGKCCRGVDQPVKGCCCVTQCMEATGQQAPGDNYRFCGLVLVKPLVLGNTSSP